MFVEDLREDFYNVLLGNRVLLLVHYDVDAICTCKILQSLFKCDNISYTLVPVGGISELKSAYEENNEEVKFVVMVNCGGTIDLVQILQPEEDVVFFVIDAHKPTDVCNVYSDGQVRLVHRDDDENIPEFDDIFRDDEDDEEEEPESSHRDRSALESLVERRRARRAWEERRHTLLFNYTQFSYYGRPSACVAISLSHRLSRVSVGGVWAAAVACAAAAALLLRPGAARLLDCDRVHAAAAGCTPADHTQSARVVLEKDVWLPLYREWSVESALRHSPLLAPPLLLHTVRGEARLRRLLADMGFPLQQARQAFRAMDVSLRRGLPAALQAAAAAHRLPPPTLTTFTLYRPHSPTVAALDLVYAVLGLIEHESIPKAEGFQLALSALDIDSGENEARRIGTESAKRTLEAIARLVNATLAGKKLRLAGPFSYFIVQEGSPDSWSSIGPHWLSVMARWAARAGAGSRPLVCSAPAARHGGVAMATGGSTAADVRANVIGVPPSHDHEPRNLFGAAFEQAAAKSGAAVSLDYIDSSIVTLPVQQRTQFLDALTALLA